MRTVRFSNLLSLALVTLFACAALACSDDCPTLQACDIRESSCQRETAEVAACLRGSSARDVSVEVVDADAFIEEQVLMSIANPETAEERDLDRGLALLQLVAPSAESEQRVRESWSWVGGFYDSDSNAITILDRGHDVDGPSAVVLLLHEMIHAMQHADPAVDAPPPDSTYDERLASSAVREGEAELYEDLAKLDGYGRDRDDVDWSDIYGQYQQREWIAARQTQSPYEFAGRDFRYAFGGAYVNRAWRTGGTDAVRGVYASQVSSTRQILAGHGAVAPGGASWKDDPNELGKPILGAEFEHVATRHLGTWLFEIWKDLSSATSGTSNGFSDSGFAGDVLNVFRLPATGDVTSVWRLRFDSVEAAAALFSSLSPDPSLTLVMAGRDILVFADTRGAPPQSFVDALTWEASSQEDWTKESPPAAPRDADVVLCGRAHHSDDGH